MTCSSKSSRAALYHGFHLAITRQPVESIILVVQVTSGVKLWLEQSTLPTKCQQKACAIVLQPLRIKGGSLHQLRLVIFLKTFSTIKGALMAKCSRHSSSRLAVRLRYEKMQLRLLMCFSAWKVCPNSAMDQTCHRQQITIKPFKIIKFRFILRDSRRSRKFGVFYIRLRPSRSLKCLPCQTRDQAGQGVH